ncbi:hypothetical protein [Duganella callida]|uniref:Uncharacterized protein n=1 Tax=Duganella callida TaxID=2561932 RepID=A0A4Y9S5J8_9BURK|nr:hypothetical protein [Duganella callida]TFW14768.1 hypothetical protein E4L98_27535 [Duganella callida]
MPKVICTSLFPSVEKEGFNHDDRTANSQNPIDNWKVEAVIRGRDSVLAAHMKGLQKANSTSRVAFSCAEADALAQVILGGGGDISSYRFRSAKQGNEVWMPCVNCETWLVPDGDGYRIRASVLGVKSQPPLPPRGTDEFKRAFPVVGLHPESQANLTAP